MSTVAHIAGLRTFWTDWHLRKLSSAHKTSNPGCCSASLGRLPRAIGRRSDAWLAAALPLLLLAAALPWPAKAPKALLVHLA